MSHVYVRTEQGITKEMERVYCKDEGRELQLILELNPDLLPGDQIDPDDPRRWMLIKREMPVRDLSSGDDRWSIDLFFVDQSGIPTFVECKRFGDTRNRREVVGQMLEYASNAQWTNEEIRGYAEESARKQQLTLEEALRALNCDEDESPDSFFDRVLGNFHEGRVRLVFFLEEAPSELKSIVAFLNRQMEQSEVLLVEAKQYTDGEIRIVVPMLFGYTERAYPIKKPLAGPIERRKRWQEATFFDEAREPLDSADFRFLEKLYKYGQNPLLEITWGTGQRGSFGIRYAPICPRTILTMYSDGTLWLNLGSLYGSENVEAFRDELQSDISRRLKLPLPSDHRTKSIPLKMWGPQVDELIEIIDDLITRWSKEHINQEAVSGQSI